MCQLCCSWEVPLSVCLQLLCGKQTRGLSALGILGSKEDSLVST